jgi:hypothetical protein
MSEEEWVAIPSAPTYAVSTLGRVRREIGSTRAKAGNILRLTQERHGYLKVHLDGRTRRVHQLVAEAFLGPRPEGKETCHNNGDPSDNRLTNLRYDTPAANSADRIQHGTANRGERHGSARLTEDDVHRIRAQFAQGMTDTEIASPLGVSRRTIGDIRSGATWSWLRDRQTA